MWQGWAGGAEVHLLYSCVRSGRILSLWYRQRMRTQPPEHVISLIAAARIYEMNLILFDTAGKSTLVLQQQQKKNPRIQRGGSGVGRICCKKETTPSQSILVLQNRLNNVGFVCVF